MRETGTLIVQGAEGRQDQSKSGEQDRRSSRRRGSTTSFRFPQGFQLDQQNRRVFLPKLGWVRYRNSQEVLG